MTDIIIYTTKETLEHKKGSDGFEEYYWRLTQLPKNINIGDKIYFAVNKAIVGYFIITEIDDTDIVWHKDSWKDITPITQKPFQGFKYKRKED